MFKAEGFEELSKVRTVESTAVELCQIVGIRVESEISLCWQLACLMVWREKRARSP